jgi:putative hydrolase of HD superfamily
LEYENVTSAEASLAHQLDKLEMIIQADEYERQENVLLDSFFTSTADSFTHPEVIVMFTICACIVF